MNRYDDSRTARSDVKGGSGLPEVNGREALKTFTPSQARFAALAARLTWAERAGVCSLPMGRFGPPARSMLCTCAVMTVLLASAVRAGAAASWRSLGTSGQLNVSDLVGTARGSDGTLHVAWSRRTSNGLYDLMQTPVDADGLVRSPAPIVTGWASIEGPTLLASGSALFAFFSGTQTLVTGDPHEGVDYALTADGGASWALAPTALAAGDFAGERDASVALGPDGALTSWYAGEETVVHSGTDPTTIDQRGYGLGTGQAIAVSGDSALVAWCAGVQGPNGVFVQSVDPATGAPAGVARIVPGSTSPGSSGAPEAFCPASTRVPLVARQAKGFFVATVDGSRRTVYGWSVGAARPHRLAGGSSYKQQVAAAASPGPKASVWVGWVQDGKVVLRRSNPGASVFGATVTLNGPRDGSIYGLDLNAQDDRVDLVARVQHDSGIVGLERTQSYPGLTLIATSGRRPSFRVLDAGDPVNDATVTVAGQGGKTGPDGRVTITVDHPARYTARATAPRYVGASARVIVSRH
jgi:hypothetical protein